MTKFSTGASFDFVPRRSLPISPHEHQGLRHRRGLLRHHHGQAAAGHGIDYDHLEMSDDVGGNWYYDNPNGRSACYQSLHIDTSKTRLQFEDFPTPEEWPDFPHHSQMHEYFRDYTDHFGLREKIEFGVGVVRAVRRAPKVAGTSPSPPARPAATPTSSSPTAITGTRASPTTRASSPAS